MPQFFFFFFKLGFTPYIAERPPQGKELQEKEAQKRLKSVPHLDVFWYRLDGMGAKKKVPKKVIVSLFPYISRKNWMKYSLQISFSKCIEHQKFWKLSYNYWGFLGVTTLSNPWLQENGMAKKRLDMVLKAYRKSV